ncbi:MAG: translation initiation factor IF-2 [Firmicutes bacterium]|nr:translation initiation factor IF-2 [Bacillota bacterium]
MTESNAKETKIVKAAPKKHEDHHEDEPRVTVKAVAKPHMRTQTKQAKPQQQTQERPAARPPIGKPVVNKDLDNRGARTPIGKPVVPKEVSERGAEAKAAEAPKVEAPKVEEVKVEAPKTEAPKAERPARQEKPQRAEREDRPQRGERPERGDRPQRGERTDRGPRRDFGDRPQRSERPERGDRPQRGERTDRGPRKDFGDRPQRGERPERQDRGDRPQRPQQERRDSRDARPAASAELAPKQSQKRAEKMQYQDKERNKFAKLDNGGNAGKKNKQKIQERSLEKAAKPKKHNKPKPQVQEEEDIMEDLPTGAIAVTVPITVAGLCEQAGISTSQVIMALMKMGIMANINQNIDEDTVMILADELKLNIVVTKVEEEEEEEGLETFEDREEDLEPRAPIITVMGHVDHGKTSLLDAIRSTNVTVSEAGGITQHIGASEVYINGQKIVFLDTPGHEAFTAMRARGAHTTDIAVLVVAADDSVKPQTIESISHAKAAGVPIIVAINKCDKPAANPERVKQDLTEHGILVEDWGGDTICVPVSAKTRDGIENLLEMILLQAEMLELKANPNRLAMGTVIEARLDKNKGPVATLLVTNGSVKSGQSVVAGTSAGRIRLMTDFKGDTIRKAGPSTAVEILGLTEVPEAGDTFNVVKDDKLAKEIAENRKTKLREEVLARNASTTLEQLFSQIQEGETKDLNLIIKGDVTGSIGAIVSSLEKLSNENVRVKIVHTGVGTVNESDVTLAGTTGSIIIGFNVRPTTAVQALAEREKIEMRLYRVIYDIINDIEDAMKGMLDPEFKEEVLGKVEVRDTFKVPNVGVIAGAYVTEGKVVRNAEIRLVRDGIVIHEGKISSLKRFKDDAKEVSHGYECGLGIDNYNDVKIGDIIECFHMVEVERK